MAKSFLTSINLNKNELQNAVLQSLSASPANPVAGQIYYDTTDKTIYQYNGTVWKTYTQSGSIVNGDIASNAAIDLSKLATDPLARANHTGTQTASTISNFDTQVRTSRLDQMSTPTSDVNIGGYKLTGVATPVSGTDAANKNYVDASVTGLTWKSAVNLLATTNVPLTGNTGTVIIDGHSALTSIKTGYRLLLTGQTTSTENGIYLYTDNGTTYTLSRSTDADTYQELIGATVFVDEGTTYGKTSWTQSNTYLTSFASQTWVQFSGASTTTAGAGLIANGNAFDVVGTTNRITVNSDSVDIASTYVGQTSITTLGTITAGTWNGSAVPIANGGTGATTVAGARSNLGVISKYTAANSAITVSSSIATWSITAATHGLGAVGSLIVQMKEISSGAVVDADIVINDTTGDVTVSWNSATNVSANTYRLTIVG
jgi:hypothetical protein